MPSAGAVDADHDKSLSTAPKSPDLRLADFDFLFMARLWQQFRFCNSTLYDDHHRYIGTYLYLGRVNTAALTLRPTSKPDFAIHQANVITSLLPHAAAYLRNVAKEGECFSLVNDASSRDTADAVVPIRSATWACVKPAACRAAKIARKALYSSSNAS
ncbi:hypothetical protein DP42_2464 [Burkholderia pseudomallei]|nr:hypothetical protein DO73_3500 [Burkholderia pseudomallei]KGD12775.1 hypothetical protein DP42_2464 [Burkholderia pseudomallei]